VQISSSALRAKQLRQSDKNPTTSISLRRAEQTAPVMVQSSSGQLAADSAWTSEYENQYRPYERSRYRCSAGGGVRRLHADLKPSTPREYRSYLMTC